MNQHSIIGRHRRKFDESTTPEIRVDRNLMNFDDENLVEKGGRGRDPSTVEQ
jgi:hypothetical protein